MSWFVVSTDATGPSGTPMEVLNVSVIVGPTTSKSQAGTHEELVVRTQIVGRITKVTKTLRRMEAEVIVKGNSVIATETASRGG